MECVTCHRTENEVELHKCPICFRYFCDDHRQLMSGRPFCSKHCAEYFFFGEDDD